jgi:predicted secreted acid phosphatase
MLKDTLKKEIDNLNEEQLKKIADFVTLLKAEDKQKDEEFEAIANKLAEDFKMYVGQNILNLSDDAVSREGIYEEHL